MTTVSQTDFKKLARFRYAIRKLLRSSEDAARQVKLTPQHHQLLLGIAGFTGEGWATVGDLAEFLQVRHHSVVGLVDRAQEMNLVKREVSPDDRREVRVSLTAEGMRKLRTLADLHHKELSSMRRSLDLLEFEGQRTQRRKARRRRSARA
jgi:DNA-binding MarR family transcriptional regulator